MVHARENARNKILNVLRDTAAQVAAQIAHPEVLKADTGDDDPAAQREAAQKKADRIVAELDLSRLGDGGGAIRSDLAHVAQDAAALSLKEITPPGYSDIFGRTDARVLNWARDQAADLVTKLDPATRDMLRGTITDGLARNIPQDDLAQEIRDSYAFSERRATVISATEIGTANSMGSLISYQEAKADGIDVKKSWDTSDEAPCAICQANEDEGPIELDEEFESGDLAPLAHPNCECCLTPVVTRK